MARPYARVDKEDPEERRRWRARFLIYKVMEEADRGGRRGRRHRNLRSSVCGAGACVFRRVMKGLRSLKQVFCGKQQVPTPKS
ncbi:unnamed protein product [Musa banksii]